MKTRRTELPTYEVEFVPLERRMKDRRKAPDACYLGPERRKASGRRDKDPTFARTLVITH